MLLHPLHQALDAGPRRAEAPVLFIGHGSPMNILRDNRFTRHLHALGRRLERPAAALVISAHWLTPHATRVAASPRPATLHDFGGFPEALYQIRYPAPGAPQQARALAAEVTSLKIHEDHEMGLDHGAWSILHHLWPAADVPVFQLSIDYAKPPAFHLELGRELRRLRERGVLILGSGNIVHNLRRLAPDEDSPSVADWAAEFDAWVGDRLVAGDHAALADYPRQGAAASLAVPTPDHYLPLLYSLGALHPDEPINFTYEGFQHGSISMRCLEATRVDG